MCRCVCVCVLHNISQTNRLPSLDYIPYSLSTRLPLPVLHVPVHIPALFFFLTFAFSFDSPSSLLIPPYYGSRTLYSGGSVSVSSVSFFSSFFSYRPLICAAPVLPTPRSHASPADSKLCCDSLSKRVRATFTHRRKKIKTEKKLADRNAQTKMSGICARRTKHTQERATDTVQGSKGITGQKQLSAERRRARQ